MNGGYQTLDLRNATAGDPVTIKGSYDTVKGSNGKSILVLDKDGQEVFAQAKKVSSNYVITYLSAEGKTVKVTITDEDAVTTVIEDDSASIEALTQGINEVSNAVDELNSTYVGTAVDIDSYTGASEETIYTCPVNGWCYVETITSGGEGRIYAKRTDTDEWALMIAVASSQSLTSCYCKKGMKLKVENIGGTPKFGFRYNNPIS